ncbi:ornithine carbamoyltransferase [Actinophytocola oryzae]|uniref:Ornithine carbamoyltransferase/carbamoyltransferase n=1 Tax=Actinophytocola oryzae TaxID=502181 RepID=A0A4R7VRP3_9PSEU|nr:ornithine carbamoyltransferase [Actinophytocola oryzae]TDV51887.1 ornithine carbamoyltransferase/carbamoyltransferase [Actinophytocola oryzae]
MSSVKDTPEARTESGLLSLCDLDEDDLHHIVARSVELHWNPLAHDRPLSDKAIGVLFTRTSTRTRTAFSVGAHRLGAHVLTYGPDDLQLNTGESLADTARVLGSMLDGLVARTAGPVRDLRTISREGRIPVVNAMATEEHPTQGICDLATMRLHRGHLDGVTVLYIGEGNNSATALAHGLAKVPSSTLIVATPDGYGIPEDELTAARKAGAAVGASVETTTAMDDLPTDVDFVYTTRWQTTGTTKPDPDWREAFRPFHVDETLLARSPSALFMHDLPACRGEEVSGAVLDGSRSIAWDQAAMKLSSAMAVLEFCAAGRPWQPRTDDDPR